MLFVLLSVLIVSHSHLIQKNNLSFLTPSFRRIALRAKVKERICVSLLSMQDISIVSWFVLTELQTEDYI